MTIDVNVHLGRWPSRRLAGDDPTELIARLKRHGVTQAWAGNFDALLHRDIARVNLTLCHECERYGEGLLIPFGAVNPMLPGWEVDLRRCHEDQRMRGIRIYPSYHGYGLEHPLVGSLLEKAAGRNLIVQVVVRMEDERAAHPLLRVPPVDCTVLADRVAPFPRLRLVVLNGLGLIRGEVLQRLVAARTVAFDFTTLEGIAGIARLLDSVPADRLLFGSNFPLFSFDSALLKLREAALPPDLETAIRQGNAKRLLGP